MKKDNSGDIRNLYENVRWHQRLSFRLAALLTIALLPLGLIAVLQTAKLERELARSRLSNAKTVTEERARREVEAIKAAFGAAAAFSTIAERSDADPRQCSAMFRSFVETSQDQFVFGGIIPRNGIVTCSSADRTYDLSGSPRLAGMMEDPRPIINVSLQTPVSQTSAIVISLPYFDSAGDFTGYVTVSLSQSAVDTEEELDDEEPLDIFTITGDGEILTASGDMSTAESRLPADREIKDLTASGRQQFLAQRRDGALHYFAVVPIVPGKLYAVGSTLAGVKKGLIARLLSSPTLFPLAMWVGSLILINIAVDRQVVGQVRRLALEIRRFGTLRELPKGIGASVPAELKVIDEEFRQLAERLTQDEAILHDAIHDKSVLLKEVHHRVKNNLQLISSIVNMQERRATDERTIAALENVSQRVSSMAAVHRELYQAESLGRMPAEDLLRAIVTPLVDLAPRNARGARPKLIQHYDSVVLYPDQALPAALLTVEAVTNALKYAMPGANGGRWIKVSLTLRDEKTVELNISNSVSVDETEPNPESTGMGSKLISAFARQLGSSVTVTKEPGEYRLSVAFEALPFGPDPIDEDPEPAV